MLASLRKSALPVSAAIALLILARMASADPPAVPRQVRKVRYWSAPERTRVVLDMSTDSYYRVRTLTSPHRIVVDISSGRFSSRVKPIEVNDGTIDRIRINRLRSGAQVVLDLPGKTTYRTFALKPNRNKPHRIIIDVDRVLSRDEIYRARNRAREIAGSGDYVVIIDPGHGGSQPGACSRSGIREKDIVLAISKMLADEINAHEGFRAVMTRTGDYDVGLGKRINIARTHGGDCFVSIHVNSVRSSRPRGSEVFFLSLEGATDENAEAVAERENMLLEMGDEGEKITDDLKSILFDLNRSNIMKRSSLLAGEIATQMRSIQALPFRGVKQANFVVLRSIAMPSVLFETAFLSNKKDAGLLRKKEVLKGIAHLLARGIMNFLVKRPSSDTYAEDVRQVIHTVSSGETLWRIAKRYGVTVERIRSLNGLGGKSRISPGQKLRIYR